MNVIVSCRPHFWEWFPKGDWKIELEDGSTFDDLVSALATKLPLDFAERMEDLKQDKTLLVALVNGRSIAGLKHFDTKLEPDSQVTFTLMLSGG